MNVKNCENLMQLDLLGLNYCFHSEIWVNRGTTEYKFFLYERLGGVAFERNHFLKVSFCIKIIKIL